MLTYKIQSSAAVPTIPSYHYESGERQDLFRAMHHIPEENTEHFSKESLYKTTNFVFFIQEFTFGFLSFWFFIFFSSLSNKLDNDSKSLVGLSMTQVFLLTTDLIHQPPFLFFKSL